jgi:CheY-like chemotaxis protein
MPTESAPSRKWVSRALRAGRVAAFLTLATGINGAIATFAPRYEPIYVYLISIAIIAWLGSLLLGITAAVAAVVVYDFMFAPVRTVATMSAIVPLAIAVSIAVATRMVRAPLTRPRAELRPATPPPLLASPEPIPVEVTTPSPDRSAEIEELEQRLSAAMGTAEREARLRAEAGAATRFRVAALQREVDEARDQVVQQVNRNANLRAEHEQAIAALQRELAEQAAAANQNLQKAIADLASKYQAPLADAKKRLEDAFTRIPQLEKELASAHAEIAQLQTDLGAARKATEDIGTRAELELAQRERENIDFDQKLERIVAGLTKDYEESLGQAMVEKEGAKAEVRTLQKKLQELQRRHQDIDQLQREVMSRAASSEARVADLTEQIGRLHAEAAAHQNRADREAMLREQSVTELSTKYDTAIADSQQVIGRLHHELEASRLETRATIEAASEKIAELRSELAAARKAADAAAELAAKSDNALTDTRARIARLEADLTTARKAADDVTFRAELEKAQRERESLEADQRLERIVSELTKDWEESLGQAMVEKESARAEARTVEGRVQEVQRRLEEERTARQRLDLEWNEKLQRIVSNIAIDHEHDMGEALLEREAAKAELRSLTSKLHTLQQKFEQERARWNHERARLTGRPMVLVVHSDPQAREASREFLEEAGYSVLVAADGLEGLRVASTHKPAAVVAEAVMPKMNGRELVQLLKSRPETADIKIVLVGGSAGGETVGTEFRADDHIGSATDLNLLRATLANVLSKVF